MPDRYADHAESLVAPAARAFAIVPHDSQPLPETCRAIHVGGGGAVVLRPAAGSADVTFAGLPAGALLPVRASHVRAAGTTATALVALV